MSAKLCLHREEATSSRRVTNSLVKDVATAISTHIRSQERRTRPLLLQLQKPNTIFQHDGTRRMITSAVSVGASSLDGHTNEFWEVTRNKMCR